MPEIVPDVTAVRAAGHSLFDRLHAGAPGELLRQATPVSFEPQAVIHHARQSVTAVHVLRRGRVKLVTYLESGRARIVRLHARGSVLGLAGLVGKPHAHTAQAIDPVSAWRIPLAVLVDLKETEPELYAALAEDCLRNLETADTWISEFNTGPVRCRVARLVLYLDDLESRPGSHELMLLTSEEMAEIVGATAESVSRVIAKFKRNGILVPVESTACPHHFLIDDPSRLRRETGSS